MAIQGFLTLLDVGLAQIIPRDIARAGATKEALAQKFAVFSRAYFILAAIAFCVGQMAVPWLVTNWIKITDGSQTESIICLRLAFIMFFFQFWNTVHIGYWNGMQEQQLANIRQVLFATLKHGTAVVLVLAWSKTAEAYLLAFTIVTAIEWTANRFTIARHFSKLNLKVKASDLFALTRETGALSAGVVLGMLVSQMDRFTLSSLVPVADFGRYIAVANLGLAFFQFQTPVLNAFFPRLSVELPRGETRSLRHLTLGIVALNVLPCLLAAAATPMLLQLWIHNPQIVLMGTPPLRLILVAIAVNSLYQIFYQQIVVHGQGKYLIWINAINVVVVGSFLFFMAPLIGIVAGGWGWLLGATMQLIAGLVWLFFLRPPRATKTSK